MKRLRAWLRDPPAWALHAVLCLSMLAVIALIAYAAHAARAAP